MKKSLLALAVLAGISMLFMGCPKGTDTPAEPTSDPATNVGPAVVFDPAVYKGDVGEVVEKDGVKYLKVTPKEYSTVIDVAQIELKGKTTFKTTLFAEAGQAKNATCQYFVSLLDAEGNIIADMGMYKPLPEAPKEYSAKHFESTQWNKASESDVCVKIQPKVQENGGSYAAQNDVVVYIGKIIAE